MATCKHHWKILSNARSISKDHPKTHDTINSILFCPKCLTTKTILNEVLRERPNTLSEIELLILDLETLKPPVLQRSIVLINLKRLGYKSETIKTLLDIYDTPTASHDSLVFAFNQYLLQEHHVLCDDILTKKIL